MKRKILVSGLLVCLLILGLIFVSCGDDSSEPSFEGTWRLDWDRGKYATYVFSGNTFECTYNDQPNTTDVVTRYRGAFSYTSTTITFTKDTGNSWTQKYTLTKDYLDLVNDSSGAKDHFGGRFLKK